jgi:hypothetical protein
MRLLRPIILTLFGTVNGLGHKLTMCNAVAAQLVSHNLPGFAAMCPEQAPEEPFRSGAIPFRLEIHINYFAILVNCPPKIVLLAVDFDEDFVDVEGIAIATMLAFQSTCIDGTKLDTPESDRFAAYGDTSFGQELFNIAVAVTTRLRLNLK